MKTVEIYNMAHLYISVDMIHAIKRITFIDFRVTQCVESRKAEKISNALNSFVNMRTADEYRKFMDFYGLYSLSNDTAYFKSVINQFSEASDEGNGVCVEVTG